MPVYEYQCKKCEHEFEREQRISDKPVKKCPSCGALQARRLISRTSFVLKGGGWYGDLYSSQAPGKGDGDDSGGAGGADAPEKKSAKKKDKSDSSKGDSSKGDSSKSSSSKKKKAAA